MTTKYQIFISSTYEDLKEERSQVIKAILETGNFPLGMELFRATDESQWAAISQNIEQSDYFVLLLAHRYGSTTNDGKSYTEKEFDHAAAKGIPILSFVLDENETWPHHYYEEVPKAKRSLKAFKKKVLSRRLVRFWKNKDELISAVTVAITGAARNIQRPGWVRFSSRPTTDHKLSLRRSDIHWTPFNNGTRERYWVAGTSLIGIIERGLLDTFAKREISDIRVILPSTEEGTSSLRQLADYDSKATTSHFYNQVEAAERAYFHLRKKISKLFPERLRVHFRRYDGVMYFNITIFDGDAILSPYDSHGVGETNLTLHLNETLNPRGFRYAIKEFERMWSPGPNARDQVVQEEGQEQGVSVIFINSSHQVMLYRRDNKRSIPFPDRWDLIGGRVESGETPEESIARELLEELEYNRVAPELFKVYAFEDRVEHTFFIEDDVEIESTPLHEGQYLRWFSRYELESMPEEVFGFGFKQVIEDFYHLRAV